MPRDEKKEIQKMWQSKKKKSKISSKLSPVTIKLNALNLPESHIGEENILPMHSL